MAQKQRLKVSQKQQETGLIGKDLVDVKKQNIAKKVVTDIAQPVVADKAIKDANAFQLDDVTPLPTQIDPVDPVVVDPVVSAPTEFSSWVDWQKNNPNGSYTDWKAEQDDIRLANAKEDANAAPLTPEELAEQDRLEEEGVVEGELEDINEIAAEYGLEGGEETIQGIVDEFKSEQEEEMSAAELEVERLNKLDVAEQERFEEQAEGAKGATGAAFAQTREGAVSEGASELTKEFTAEMDKRIGEANLRLTMAQAQRDKYLLDLEKAQKAGQTKLAEKIQKRLSNARLQIEKSKTDYLNALTTANQEARLNEASQRENLNAFTGLVEKGTELNNASLISIANSLNIPTEMAIGYYEGAELIRKEKGLDVADKQIKLNNLAFEFDEKVQGIRSDQARSIKDFTTLSQSGNYSPEQLVQFATAMNIPNEMNPLFQAEIKLKKANALLAEKKANGVAITPAERLEQYEAQAELNKLMGITGDAFVPEKSLNGITVTYDNGEYKVNTPADAKYQCGEAVNRTWGLASAGSQGMGDSYESKQKTVDERGVKSTDITNAQAQIKPGMAFVMPISGAVSAQGHCGIVTQVNNDGTFMSVEFNANGDETRTEQVREISQMYGFSPPPQGSTKIEGGIRLKWEQEASDLGYTGKKAKEFVEDRIADSYKTLNEAQAKSLTAYATMKTDGDLYGTILGEQENVEDFVDNLNVFSQQIKRYGLTAEAVNRTMDKIGIDDESIRRMLMAEMRWTEAYGRKQSGAAIKPEEYDSWATMFFPRAGDDSKSIQDKADARKIATDTMYAGMGAGGQRQYSEMERSQEQTKGAELFTITDMGDIQELYSEVANSLAKGVSEQEIVASLEKQGIDPYVIFNK